MANPYAASNLLQQARNETDGTGPAILVWLAERAAAADGLATENAALRRELMASMNALEVGGLPTQVAAHMRLALRRAEGRD